MSHTSINGSNVVFLQHSPLSGGAGNNKALLTLLKFQSLAEAMLARFGMSMRRWHALLLLHVESGDAEMTVSELGRQLAIQPNTTTELVKRMEADGLVQRRRSADDQRLVKVRITTAGRSLLEKVSRADNLELADLTGELQDIFQDIFQDILDETSEPPLPDSV